jgi:DNA-binding MarR family transcriptional regulator
MLNGRMSEKAKKPALKNAKSSRRAAAACPWEKLGESGRGLHVDQFLTFHLIRLANAAKTQVTRRYLLEFDLSVPEWRLLALTMRFTPARFAELVSRSHMDKGQVSRTLQALTKRGLVSAKTVGPQSKGAARDSISPPVVVSVTAKGRKLYESILPVAQRNQAAILNTLSTSERKTLHSVLTRLFDTINNSGSRGI